MSILCIVLAIALGLAIKELRNKATELEFYRRTSNLFDERIQYLDEEIAKQNDYIKCLQKQCDEYTIEHLQAVLNIDFDCGLSDEQASRLVGINSVNDDAYYNSNISWNLDEDKNELTEAQIYVNTVKHFSEEDIWMFDYLNKEFGVNLKFNAKTYYTFKLLHEIGHFVDFMSQEDLTGYRNNNNESYAMIGSIEYGEEQWLAYRQVTSEYNADKFAIEAMIKHFPELV